MTLDELWRDWQKYLIDIDVHTEGKHFRAKLILKDRFFVCFKVRDPEGLMFDPGGHDPICYTYKSDEDNNCYLLMSGGRWFKIGKFVRIE